MTTQNRRVAAQVRAVIRQSSDSPLFRDLLLQLMARPDRILAQITRPNGLA